jgi:hypothetical protein
MRLRIFSFAATLLLFAFYCLCLPHFLQGGDTTELVSAAYFKLVAHPPGYPLWIWLQHFWISIWPSGSVFFKASLLNAIFAMKALFAVAMAPLGWLGILPVFWMGTGQAFMESAILPDVFAFNALFVAAIGYYYLFRSESDRLRAVLIPLYFAIGLTNHLTLVVLAPVVLHVLWNSIRQPKLRGLSLTGTAIGIAGFVGLYLSLLLLDTQNPFSWGHLHGFGSIIHHFLRSDYGTFALTANEKNAFSFDPLLDFISRSLIWYLPALVALLCFNGRAIWSNRRFCFWSVSFVLSVGLFLAFHIPTNPYGKETLIRFHVMPMVLLSFLMAFLLLHVRNNKRATWVAVLLTIPILVSAGRQVPGLMEMANDSVVEDYSRQLMREASEHQPALVFTENDTSYSGLRHIQMLEYPQAKIGVAMYFHFFDKNAFEKLKLKLPELTLSNSEKIWSERKMKLAEDLFKPNYKAISLFTVRPFKGSDEMKITFHPLGRRLSLGKDIEFANEEIDVPAKTYANLPSGPQYFTRAYLYSQYAHYHLAKGMKRMEEKKNSEAVEQFEKALAIVPYAYPALIRVCEITRSQDGRCESSNVRSVKSAGRYFF